MLSSRIVWERKGEQSNQRQGSWWLENRGVCDNFHFSVDMIFLESRLAWISISTFCWYNRSSYHDSQASTPALGRRLGHSLCILLAEGSRRIPLRRSFYVIVGIKSWPKLKPSFSFTTKFPAFSLRWLILPRLALWWGSQKWKNLQESKKLDQVYCAWLLK